MHLTEFEAYKVMHVPFCAVDATVVVTVTVAISVSFVDYLQQRLMLGVHGCLACIMRVSMLQYS